MPAAIAKTPAAPTGIARDDLVVIARLTGRPLADLVGMSEAERIDILHVAAAPPAALADSLPAAPARGAFRTYPIVIMEPVGPGQYRPRKGTGVSVMDAFDRMAGSAARSKSTCGLTLSQVSMARRYGELCRAIRDGASPRSCLDFTPKGAGGGLSFLEVRLMWRDEITTLQNRSGDGIARPVRRIRPSARGSRAAIRDRSLIDMVAIDDLTVAEVLRRHGWARDDKTVRDLTAALADICDRMMGPAFRRRLSTCHYGAPSQWPEAEGGA